MKVTLMIELELPDDTFVVPGHENESLVQLLFDDYVNYVTATHYQDALKWCVRAKLDSDNEDAEAKAIYLHHDRWGNICSKAKWTMAASCK